MVSGDSAQLPSFLLGTNAYNAHAQNIARALFEVGGLHTYVTGGVDSYRSLVARVLRRGVGTIPGLDRELSRRAVKGLPQEVVHTHWGLEAARVLANRMGLNERLVDWLWERSELGLDETCAQLVRADAVGAFIGIEHGALASLKAARALGKPAIVAFFSPHHQAYRKYVEPEYVKFPELDTPERTRLSNLAYRRDERRDEEAQVADWIVTGSSFTSRSLVDAGFPAGKILDGPAGRGTPIDASQLPAVAPAKLRVAYVGTVSVRKGVHQLLRSWARVATRGMELHLYGEVTIPRSACDAAMTGAPPGSVVFHGSVPAKDLSDVYMQSSVLVLPTLCDGWGQVVSDALSHGLPVITTTHAGAADRIENGRSGFVIPAGDEDALSTALTWCAEHPSELFEMRRPALETAAQATWAQFRHRLIDVMSEAIFQGRKQAQARRSKGRVCIVTPGHVCSTPRAVREADALWAAGYEVRVAFTQGPLEKSRQFDRELLTRKPWRTSIFRWSNLPYTERWAYHRTRVRHGIARTLPQIAWRVPGLLERAQGRVFPELCAIAAAEPADLYIGHYPSGLVAAHTAAERHRAAVSYDVEDLYADAFPLTEATRKDHDRIVKLEYRHVPRCSYVSAVSRPVAAVFGERYHVEPPVVAHNCHAWADRETLDGQVLQRQGRGLSLYWFSQTVGLDRGIQDAIRAAGLMTSPVEIHLQGSATEDVRRALMELADACGVAGVLHFHAPVTPAELPSRAAEHDVGLALETAEILNRRIAVTNKAFLYMVAGVAIAATDIPGQRGILETCPSAGLLYAPGDIKALAAQLSTWVHDPCALAAAKQASLEAARVLWNWERESQGIVSAVERTLRARTAEAAG